MIILYQHRDGSIELGVKSGSRTQREHLTPERAQTLAYKLQSFAASQQTQAVWELPL